MSSDLAAWLLEQIDWTADEVARPIYETHRDVALLLLSECDAKRRIVEMHGALGHAPCDAHDASLRSIHCDTLLLLALPYAGRPGYREEWRSDTL